MQGIYKIINKINGKYYVGSSIDIKRRWADHIRDLQKGYDSIILQRAWNKYGESSFEFQVVENLTGGREALIQREQEYLDVGFSKGVLYNVAQKAGGGNLGEEVNRKISEAKMGEKNPNYGKDMSGEKSPWFGEHHTEEAKAKISKSVLGENNPFYGKHHTEEALVRIREGAARPYPSFYNDKTEEFIPAGRDLLGMSRERGLSHAVMYNLKAGLTEKSGNGWRLATVSEIVGNGVITA